MFEKQVEVYNFQAANMYYRWLKAQPLDIQKEKRYIKCIKNEYHSEVVGHVFEAAEFFHPEL